MPKASRLLKSMQRLGSAPRLSTRARLVRLPNDPTAYALDATAPPPAAKPADPPIPADFSPVNLRKRQPLT